MAEGTCEAARGKESGDVEAADAHEANEDGAVDGGWRGWCEALKQEERRFQKRFGRRMRKGRSAWWTEKKQTPQTNAVFLGFVLRPQEYHASTKQAVTYWVAMFFLAGSILFVIGAASSLKDNPSTAFFNWMVNAPYNAGTTAFFLGCCMLLPECMNGDLDHQLEMWAKSGKVGEQPKFKWFRWPNQHWIAFWAAIIELFGATLFCVGSAASAAQTNIENFPEWAEWTFVIVPYFVGGLAFTVGGYMFIREETTTWYEGILPLSKEDLGHLEFWINSLNFWGGMGFLLSGAFGFDTSIQPWLLDTELAIGYVGGSSLFMVASYLMAFELMNP